jgi:hypothetical protein
MIRPEQNCLDAIIGLCVTSIVTHLDRGDKREGGSRGRARVSASVVEYTKREIVKAYAVYRGKMVPMR